MRWLYDTEPLLLFGRPREACAAELWAEDAQGRARNGGLPTLDRDIVSPSSQRPCRPSWRFAPPALSRGYRLAARSIAHTGCDMSLFPEQSIAEFAATLAIRRDSRCRRAAVRGTDAGLVRLGARRQGRATRSESLEALRCRHGACARAHRKCWSAARTTSPLFAAMVNAASSHVAEQDDVHNGSVFHPAAVVFPPALAVAQAIGASGKELLTRASSAMKSASASANFSAKRIIRCSTRRALRARSRRPRRSGGCCASRPSRCCTPSAPPGTQAAGLWEFLRDAADSKPLHTAHAAASGLTSAYLAADGFTGAKRILTGDQAMAAGMSKGADPQRLTDRLGRALGARGDVVQVPRVLPSHPSGRRRAAAGDAGERAEAGAMSAMSPRASIRRRSTCWAR